MSKIICDLCGTSYSETALQCPICGCARPVEVQGVLDNTEQVAPEPKYQPVKGGRFSKSNVRKRNSGKMNAATSKPKAQKVSNQTKDSSNKGLIITIFVLLLAIIAVIAYNAISFFGPSLFDRDSAKNPDPATMPSGTDAPTVPCTDLVLENTQITIDVIGETTALVPVVTPVDTTDSCVFSTADETVATVNADGLITAVGSGETVITVTCGEVSVSCNVVVPEPVVPFVLDLTDITLTSAGEECVIYTGTLPLSEMIWASDDEEIATVDNGRVTAVSNGTTTIYASYNGEMQSCTVRCEFTEPTDDTSAPAADNGPYRLKNRFGFSDSDATIRIGETFTLVLLDKNSDTVSGVAWSVVDGDCCTVTDGVVEGVSSGQAKVVASYNGETFSFLVRVS